MHFAQECVEPAAKAMILGDPWFRKVGSPPLQHSVCFPSPAGDWPSLYSKGPSRLGLADAFTTSRDGLETGLGMCEFVNFWERSKNFWERSKSESSVVDRHVPLTDPLGSQAP